MYTIYNKIIYPQYLPINQKIKPKLNNKFTNLASV